MYPDNIIQKDGNQADKQDNSLLTSALYLPAMSKLVVNNLLLSPKIQDGQNSFSWTQA